MTIDHPLALALLDAEEEYSRAVESGRLTLDARIAMVDAREAWAAAGYPRSLLACAREVALDALLRDAPT